MPFNYYTTTTTTTPTLLLLLRLLLLLYYYYSYYYYYCYCYSVTQHEAYCWPVAGAGRDVVGIAKTGSGKTLVRPSVL